MSVTAKKRTAKISVTEGCVHIKATFNNTIITITTLSGDVLCHKSAGQCGFKGARKATPYAAQLAAEAVAQEAKNMNMKRVGIDVSGPGAGRDSAMRAIRAAGLEVTRIRDMTGVAFNGVRSRKKRRV